MIKQQEIIEILEIGTKAINPYNTQPWRFKINDNSVDIYIIRSKNFFLKLEGVMEFTLGALMENMNEGAKSKGYSIKWSKIMSIKGLDFPCVTATFTKNSIVDYSVQHVLERNTNLQNYDSKNISATLINKLIESGNDKNIEIRFTEGEDKNYLSGILADLDWVRASNNKMFQESLNYIRFSAAEVNKHKDLLDARNLSMSNYAIKLLQKCKSNKYWHYLVHLIGKVKQHKLETKEKFINSSALVSFSIKTRSYENLVKAGATIQHLMNSLSKEGIASMPILSGIFLFEVLAENPEIFSDKHKNTILNCKWDLEQFFKLQQNQKKLVFLLRIGYANQVKHPSQRKNIADLLK